MQPDWKRNWCDIAQCGKELLYISYTMVIRQEIFLDGLKKLENLLEIHADTLTTCKTQNRQYTRLKLNPGIPEALAAPAHVKHLRD